MDRKAEGFVSSALRRKTRLAPMSKKRRDDLVERAKVRGQVFERDHHRCVLAGRPQIFGGCFGRLTPHHIVKASQGGKYELGNLISLCVGHNEWVEDHPVMAEHYGLVVRPSAS